MAARLVSALVRGTPAMADLGSDSAPAVAAMAEHGGQHTRAQQEDLDAGGALFDEGEDFDEDLEDEEDEEDEDEEWASEMYELDDCNSAAGRRKKKEKKKEKEETEVKLALNFFSGAKT